MIRNGTVVPLFCLIQIKCQSSRVAEGSFTRRDFECIYSEPSSIYECSHLSRKTGKMSWNLYRKKIGNHSKTEFISENPQKYSFGLHFQSIFFNRLTYHCIRFWRFVRRTILTICYAQEKTIIRNNKGLHWSILEESRLCYAIRVFDPICLVNPKQVIMEKLILCRLCLANSGTTTFISDATQAEALLQKYNLLFEVSNKSSWQLTESSPF